MTIIGGLNMKFDKKAKYEYEINGIKDENGYTRWYNKEIIFRFITVALTVHKYS